MPDFALDHFARRFVVRTLLVAAGATVAVIPASSAALPITCAAPCEVSASGQTGYMPVVTDIVTGSDVLWHTSEFEGHPTSENTNAAVDPCWLANVSSTDPAAPVRFDIAGSVLTATGPGLDSSIATRTCSTAVALPDGSFVVNYHCRVHPNMVGVLRVE